MKTNRLFKRVISVALSLMLMLAVAMPTFATDVTAVNAAKDGVLQIRIYAHYVLEKGADANVTTEDSILLGTGTCFLVNESTIVTNAHVADEATVLSEYGASVEEWDITIKVVVKNDVEIEATMLNYSVDMDFAILTLEQPITGKTPLTLASDSYLDSITTATGVTSLGYPGRFSTVIGEALTSYDSTSMVVTSGTVTAITDAAPNNKIVPVYMHSATISGGDSGGPLVDNSGVVIGINTWTTTVSNVQDNYAVRINEITEILTLLGIEYTSTDSVSISTEVVVVEPEVEETPVVEEPVVVVEPTPAPTAEPTPEPTADYTLYIILGVVALVIVGVVVVLIVVLGKGKKPAASAPAQSTYVSNVAPGAGAAADAGETSVLNQGAGDTTVLNAQNYGSLTRQKTGEKIVINTPRFTMGKEKGKVSYAIAGNNAISRKQIAIEAKNGGLYVSDCNSTNGTFLNGAKLIANQEVALTNGAKITMGEEEFIFSL